MSTTGCVKCTWVENPVALQNLNAYSQNDDESGGCTWNQEETQIEPEKLVDAILNLPQNKAVPGDGVSHEMVGMIATLPMTKKNKAKRNPQSGSNDWGNKRANR